MNERLLQELRNRTNFIPTCPDYRDLLIFAHRLTGDSIDNLRERLGAATYAEWAEYLAQYDSTI